jgi:hypothetical protein
MHAALLPTGKVMLWGVGFPDEPPNIGNAALWNPSKGYGPSAFTEVPPPIVDPDGDGPQGLQPAPIWCSGLSLMANGEVLVAGGNLIEPFQSESDDYDDYAGLNRLFTFDPWSQTWTEQPQMSAGRWYPGQVLLADGRTVILGGYTDEAPGALVGDELDVFTPAPEIGGVGELELQPSASRLTGLYPRLFTLPDGSVVLAGPDSGDTAVLDTEDFAWRELPTMEERRIGAAAVLEPGGPAGSWRVTQIGGFGDEDPDSPDTYHAKASTETLDVGLGVGVWTAGPSLNLTRSYHNAVLLPDGSKVVVGGGIGNTPEDGNFATDPDGFRRQVELYSPESDSWRLGPAQVEDRGYHSTALLLPDGRVWSAGDNRHPVEPGGGNSLTDTAEIYSPPYLFRGIRRPRVRAAPRALRWGDVFGVKTKPRARARDAVLVAPGTTTHSDDSGQRLVPLRVHARYGRRGRRGLDLVSPPRPEVAPPGYYMLFLLKRGVPSRATWIRLTPDAPNAPRFKAM